MQAKALWWTATVAVLASVCSIHAFAASDWDRDDVPEVYLHGDPDRDATRADLAGASEITIRNVDLSSENRKRLLSNRSIRGLQIEGSLSAAEIETLLLNNPRLERLYLQDIQGAVDVSKLAAVDGLKSFRLEGLCLSSAGRPKAIENRLFKSIEIVDCGTSCDVLLWLGEMCGKAEYVQVTSTYVNRDFLKKLCESNTVGRVLLSGSGNAKRLVGLKELANSRADWALEVEKSEVGAIRSRVAGVGAKIRVSDMNE